MGILQRCEDRDGYRVRVLAVHTTEGTSYSAAELRDASWWTGSSHAIADEHVLLTPDQGCVPYDLAAWTLRSGNRWSENLELVALASWSREEWLEHPDLLDNCARWLADRSKARGIPLVKITAGKYRAGASGVIGHVDHTEAYGGPSGDGGSHWDPGPNFPWDVVITRARAHAAGLTPGGGFLADLTEAEQRRVLALADYLLPKGNGDTFIHQIPSRVRTYVAPLIAAVSPNVDATKLAQELAPLLLPAVVEALGDDLGLDDERIEAAVRRVFADAGAA